MFKVSFIKLSSIIKQLMASVKQTFPSTVFHLPLELVSIWQAACVYTHSSKMSLKLLIDSKHNKVVFAEAGKDLVDFLLNLLALPLGTVIQLLTKSTMIGCIASLYGSLEKLDESYLQPNQNKDSILKPIIITRVTNPNFLLPDTKKPENRKLYYGTSHPGYVSDIHNSVCSHCRPQGYGTYMSQEVKFVGTNVSASKDDLSVSPMSMVSVVGLLNKIDIKDFSVPEEGINEVMTFQLCILLFVFN
jgi:hypothetical protein